MPLARHLVDQFAQNLQAFIEARILAVRTEDHGADHHLARAACSPDLGLSGGAAWDSPAMTHQAKKTIPEMSQIERFIVGSE